MRLATVAIIALLAAVVAALVLDAGAAGAPGALKITRDGNDLVVRTSASVNRSPHLLHTRYEVDAAKKRVKLVYVVVQNRDLAVRSLKEIGVEWRLAGHGAEGLPGYSYEVDDHEVGFTGAELRSLLAR